MDTLPQPLVSQPDTDGFRTFSLYAPNGEILRVSFNVERQRDYLNGPIFHDGSYSSGELERLKEAAEVAIARGEISRSQSSPPIKAIEMLHEKANEAAVGVIEEWFPSLASAALIAANDACVKRALNQVVAEYGTARIYDETAFEKLIEGFRTAIKKEMVIKPGHQPEGAERLERIEQRIRRTLKTLSEGDNAYRPTQENVADAIGIDVRRLRAWLNDLRLSWRKLLSDYQWHSGKREKGKAASK